MSKSNNPQYINVANITRRKLERIARKHPNTIVEMSQKGEGTVTMTAQTCLEFLRMKEKRHEASYTDAKMERVIAGGAPISKESVEDVKNKPPKFHKTYK